MYANWKQIDIHRITCPQQIPKCGMLEYIKTPCIITDKLYIKKNVTMIYCTNTYRKCFCVKPKLRLLTI